MNQRLPGLDLLRVGLILLGIPFHAALPYAADSLGLVHADRSSDAVAVLVVVLRTLRMPAFFLVAGFFAARLLDRRPADLWLRDRFVRLMVPFAFAAATIIPLQRVIAQLYRAESGLFLDQPQPTFHHLWFIGVLFVYCILAVLARPLFDRLAAALARSTVNRFGPRRIELGFLAVVVAAVVWELAWKAFFDAEISPQARLAGTTRLALVYLPWFAFGLVLGRRPGAMNRFAERSPATLAVAVVLLVVDVAVARVPNLESFSALHLAVWTAASWYVSRTVVGYTARLSFAAAPIVRRLGEWTMPIYLVHHPWTLACALLLLPTHWPAAVQFVLVAVLAGLGTLATCLVIDRVPLLAIPFNGRALPPLLRRSAPLPAPAEA